MRGTDLRRLYDEHAQPLYAFLLNLTRDEADTRDLLQDVFVKLARKPELLAGVRDERAFLIRLAHNAAIDAMRRRGTRDNFAAVKISSRHSVGTCRMTSSTASHCIIATPLMDNSCFTPSVGMKQTTAEKLVFETMARLTLIRAIGSGGIRTNNRKTEAGNQKAEKFRRRFLISIFTSYPRVFVVKFPSTFTWRDKLLAISTHQRHIVGELC